MSSKDLKEILERQKALSDQLRNPLADRLAELESTNVMRAFSQQSNIARMLEELNKPVAFEALERAAEIAKSHDWIRDYGKEAERATQWIKDLEAQTAGTRQLLKDLKTQYRLPKLDEATRFLREIENNSAFRATQELHKHFEQTQRAMEAMRSPWLDINNSLRSVNAFTELQLLGHTLHSNAPSYSDSVSNALRIELGDWRDKITWPDRIFTDPVARSDFYVERGFNGDLADFPPEAFEESLTLAGLGQDSTESPSGDANDDEECYQRTKEAHSQLFRFERQVRVFIASRMTEAYGENWIKQQVQPDIRAKWIDKHEKAQRYGEPSLPLIAYADFTDYVLVITKKDNWNTVFQHYFMRPELVRESFQRLHPIRLCTMHARIITQDDELYLRAETLRILKAMGLS